MPYLQLKPTDCWAGDDPKTRRGVLKRRSIQDVWGSSNPTVAGKNLLAHKRRRTPRFSALSVRGRRPEFWMRRFLFAATDRSPSATAFTTISHQVILPGEPQFWHRTHRPTKRRSRRLETDIGAPSTRAGFAKTG